MTDRFVRGKRILLVDDEPEVRTSIGMLLELDGHIITEASNGAEAVDLFSSGHFDLVATDSEMLGMKGDELARRIKQLVPQQPMLMITGYAPELDFRNPVDAILHKPFTMEELRHAIASVLPN